MKTRTIFTIVIAAFLLSTPDATCQVKINLKKRIKKEANKRANEKTDKGVKKGFDELEKGVKGLLTGEDSVKAAQQQAGNQGGAQGRAAGAGNAGAGNTGAAVGDMNTSEALTLNWSKYDFVPGDKIIFEDNLIYEENGEFPSRWDLREGTVENAVFGGDNVIMFRGGDPTIVPYLKNPENDYLPEIFTVEFDLYLPNNTFIVYFYDRKNQTRPTGETYLGITPTTMELRPARSDLPDGGSISNRWAHISVAYTNGKLKAYIDDTRLINIPHLEFNPSGVTLNAYHANDNRRYYVKNFRIAEGGIKYYDRFLQDGKIVSNGIRFDVGKASLRPESMGVMNEIYKMLSEHPDVNVSIEGHTDSDGDNDLNQKLSEDRAETVMKQLVSMGLSKDRLSFRGYGESKPVAPNDSPEGKASNRRVEFVRNLGSEAQSSSPPPTSQNTLSHQSSVSTTSYQSVKIGNQEWMQDNLDVVTFRNGDPIPQAMSAEEWQNMKFEKKAAWCYYNFSASGEGTKERLYNWFAVNDSRGLAPEGWRIPTAEDWDILRKKLTIGVAGKQMKSTTGWNGSNGTNASGFNGLPGFYCDYNGEFASPGTEAYWWGSDDDGTPWSPSIYLAAEDDYMHKHQMSKGSGLFVRCIK
ncbi:MAG: FISUMP domain-containing protein [Bacteroidales bacterium]|nr:FISUMP domain-containing protein [Bacteroidales bacterium]